MPYLGRGCPDILLSPPQEKKGNQALRDKERPYHAGSPLIKAPLGFSTLSSEKLSFLRCGNDFKRGVILSPWKQGGGSVQVKRVWSTFRRIKWTDVSFFWDRHVVFFGQTLLPRSWMNHQIFEKSLENLPVFVIGGKI
jgi:hypothetical protein